MWKVILSIKKKKSYSAIQALWIFLFFAFSFGSCSRVKDIIGEEPIQGGALSACITLNSKIDITGLESVPALAKENQFIANALYNTLVELDSITSLPAPLLVEKWEISEDKKEYLFSLKKNIYFHDGTELRAIDAVRSLSSLLEDTKISVIGSHKKNQQKIIPSNIEKIEIIDSSKFKVTLKKSDPFFLFSLSAPNTIISSRSGAGTGSFYVSFFEGDTIYADRFNPAKAEEGISAPSINHVNQEDILLDRIVFRFVPDKNIAFLALASGDADIVSLSGFDSSVPEKIENNSQFKIVKSFGGESISLFFSPVSIYFEKPDYRIAVAYSILNFLITDNNFFNSFSNNPFFSSLTTTLETIDFISTESEYKEENIILDYNYIVGDFFPDENEKIGNEEDFITKLVLEKLAATGFLVKEKDEKTISADLYITGGFSPYINPEHVVSAIFPEAFPEGFGFFEMDKETVTLVYDAIEELLQNQLYGTNSHSFYEYAKQKFQNLYPWVPLFYSADTYIMRQNVTDFAFSKGKINIPAIWKRN